MISCSISRLSGADASSSLHEAMWSFRSISWVVSSSSILSISPIACCLNCNMIRGLSTVSIRMLCLQLVDIISLIAFINDRFSKSVSTLLDSSNFCCFTVNGENCVSLPVLGTYTFSVSLLFSSLILAKRFLYELLFDIIYIYDYISWNQPTSPASLAMLLSNHLARVLISPGLSPLLFAHVYKTVDMFEFQPVSMIRSGHLVGLYA